MQAYILIGQHTSETTRLQMRAQNAGNTKTPSRFSWVLPITAVLTGMLFFSGIGFASKGGIPGPPPGGETSNNLSLPAVVTGSEITVPHIWAPQEVPELGVHFSYGCDVPESDDSFNYPNTSCVDSLTDPTEHYDALECVDIGMPCEGLEVSRIYWQKVAANEWWADDEGAGVTSREVDYVDWGDALEAVTPNDRSFIRVETQPYHNLINGFNPTLSSCKDAAVTAYLDPEIVCKVGMQMWHVSGQGITEHWGVRAANVDPVFNSYNYDSPFQIIKTINARLNITKMTSGEADCSEPGGNPGDVPPTVENWVPETAEWDGTCTIYDQPYSVELSVGGKYVYGYNWRLRYLEMKDTSCPDWLKTGFWRLTFYAPADVIFNDADTPNVAPPAIPSEVRQLPRDGVFNTVLATGATPDPEAVMLRNDLPILEDEDPDADDRLYIPVIDPDNNLTYIDICVTARTSGGGNR